MQEELNVSSKKAGKTAKNLAHKAEDVAQEVTGTGGARETLGHITDNVGEMASDYISSFNSSPLAFVRQYPVQAAIGGVVLGFILGTAIAKNAVTE